MARWIADSTHGGAAPFETWTRAVESIILEMQTDGVDPIDPARLVPEQEVRVTVNGVTYAVHLDDA